MRNPDRLRLDQLLVEKGFFPTRSQASAAIMAGIVFVDEQKVEKAGSFFGPDAVIEIKGKPSPYVGRGGLNLAKALEEFKVVVKGKTAIDIGASTGGFTDCLLQNGAEKVYAVDVGYGQLDWKLRNDPRVKVLERVNARYLKLSDLELRTSHIALCTIDVSFISLTKILPAVYGLLTEKAEVIALIKPQFEATRKQVGKGGIVKDPAVHQEVIEKVKSAAEAIGFKVQGVIKSPVEGADGNTEFLIHLVVL